MKKITILLFLALTFFNPCSYALDTEHVEFSEDTHLTVTDFYDIVFLGKKVKIANSAVSRLNETRLFVDYLLKNNIKVYGLTTGFADLRDYAVSPLQANQLSKNLIASHDAGIGTPLPKEVVLGAMVLRANSLAKGYSAFKKDSLDVLVGMINAQIIPLIPSSGSLGASGDLAFLARLGRAMQGDDVPVLYQGNILSAGVALQREKITPFSPSAKEGLALTNGTSFMGSMLALAYLREVEELENMLALQGLFLNSVGAIDVAFCKSIQNIRSQKGQCIVADILSKQFQDSPFIDHEGVQNDYSIRCLPQILGPKVQLVLSMYDCVEKELDAVTDNPLIFRDEEISSDINEKRIIPFHGKRWTVLSGGNFHGECIATAADAIAMANAKIALTMERQLTYMLNPARNKNRFPAYLITDKKNMGLLSGFMITQYTANALAQKIAQLGLPASVYNITSANECEDVVSYGATAAERLLQQIELFHQLNTVYATTVAQAYALTRDASSKGYEKALCEKMYQKIQDAKCVFEYPTKADLPFDTQYKDMTAFLESGVLREAIQYPLLQQLHLEDQSFTKTSFYR